MGKWSGRGIPPTRRKLYRYRETQRLARLEEEQLRRAAERDMDESARRSGVDWMLIEH